MVPFVVRVSGGEVEIIRLLHGRWSRGEAVIVVWYSAGQAVSWLAGQMIL